MSWRLYKTALGCNSLENFYSSCGETLKIVALLEKTFDAKAEYFPVADDELFIDFIIDHEKFIAGWDSFCGCFIMSDSPKGNTVINRLAELLSGYNAGKSVSGLSCEYPPLDFSIKKQPNICE
ncbi:MAG: hypothetical protein WC900_09285 [Oscillospiraceae bacterium]